MLLTLSPYSDPFLDPWDEERLWEEGGMWCTGFPACGTSLFHLFSPVHRHVRNMKEIKMKTDFVGFQPGSSQWESLFLLDSSTCKIRARVSGGNWASQFCIFTDLLITVLFLRFCIDILLSDPTRFSGTEKSMVSSFRHTQISRCLNLFSVAITQFLRLFQKRVFHGSQPRWLRSSSLVAFRGFWWGLSYFRQGRTVSGRADGPLPNLMRICFGGNKPITTRGRSPYPVILTTQTHGPSFLLGPIPNKAVLNF